MSFAAQTKKELTLIEEAEACCEQAELAALIRMNGTVQLSNQRVILDISTENAAIARRIYSLLKRNYNLHTELLVRKNAFKEKQCLYGASPCPSAGTSLRLMYRIRRIFVYS